jgi:hypothetical protein
MIRRYSWWHLFEISFDHHRNLRQPSWVVTVITISEVIQ